MRGPLWVLLNGKFKKRHFVLNSQCLCWYKSKGAKQPTKWVSLAWKVIRPFIDQGDNEQVRYGFSIETEETNQEFYTVDPAYLNDWVLALHPITFFTDFAADYEFGDRLGKGTYASVYSVSDRNTAEVFAAKVVNTEDLSVRSLAALRNEVKILREVSHPKLVRLHRTYVEGHQLILVMECVSTRNLQHFISQMNSFSEQAAVGFATDMLEVLQYLHTRGIIHRDIKPENILLRNNCLDGGVLADFGFACYDSHQPKLRCGSPGYVAPEVLSAHTYGTKVDVFGLGVVLHILLTGCSPFQGSRM